MAGWQGNIVEEHVGRKILFHPSLENRVCQSKIHRRHLEISFSHTVDIHQLFYRKNRKKAMFKTSHISGNQLEKLLL